MVIGKAFDKRKRQCRSKCPKNVSPMIKSEANDQIAARLEHGMASNKTANLKSYF